MCMHDQQNSASRLLSSGVHCKCQAQAQVSRRKCQAQVTGVGAQCLGADRLKRASSVRE